METGRRSARARARSNAAPRHASACRLPGPLRALRFLSISTAVRLVSSSSCGPKGEGQGSANRPRSPLIRKVHRAPLTLYSASFRSFMVGREQVIWVKDRRRGQIGRQRSSRCNRLDPIVQLQPLHTPPGSFRSSPAGQLPRGAPSTAGPMRASAGAPGGPAAAARLGAAVIAAQRRAQHRRVPPCATLPRPHARTTVASKMLWGRSGAGADIDKPRLHGVGRSVTQ
jgi:hypothetical protein